MANTINFNPPAIKAARITGKGGSSGGSGGVANWSNIGKDIASIGTSIAAGLQTRQANIRFEKQQQLNLIKERNDLTTLQYDKVALIDTLPNSTWEKSKNKMLYGLMDKFVDIKTALNDPNSGLDSSTGNAALQEIMGTVTKYAKQAPAIYAAATSLKAALAKPFGTPGAIAGGVPSAQQQILLSLIEGENVEIAAKDGKFYLYQLDDENNVTDAFNIDEYMSVTKDGTDPESYFRTIQDFSEEYKGAAKILGTPDSANDNYYTIKRETNAAGDSVVVGTTWRTPPTGDKNPLITKFGAIKNVASTGFNHLLEDENYLETMEDYWTNVIGASEIDGKSVSGQDTPWDSSDETRRTYKVKGYTDDLTGNFVLDPTGNKTETYKDPMGNELELTQKEFATYYMAQQAIEQYGPKVDRIQSSTKAPEDNKDNGSKGYSYDMYEGYVNAQKGIDAALKADPNASLESFNGTLLSAGSTSAYRLRASGQNAAWEHVILQDSVTPGGVKVKTWKPVDGEKTIPAQGAWSTMKGRTKQYRTKN